MEEKNNKRRKLFANQLHQEMFFLVFFAMFLPAALTAVCLFYLIFNLTAEQAGIPEIIAQIVIPAAQKATIILSVSVPLLMVVIIFIAYKMTHRIVGPFDRIVRELDECLQGSRKGPIRLRVQDKFAPLVELINKALDKI